MQTSTSLHPCKKNDCPCSRHAASDGRGRARSSACTMQQSRCCCPRHATVGHGGGEKGGRGFAHTLLVEVPQGQDGDDFHVVHADAHFCLVKLQAEHLLAAVAFSEEGAGVGLPNPHALVLSACHNLCRIELHAIYGAGGVRHDTFVAAPRSGVPQVQGAVPRSGDKFAHVKLHTRNGTHMAKQGMAALPRARVPNTYARVVASTDDHFLVKLQPQDCTFMASERVHALRRVHVPHADGAVVGPTEKNGVGGVCAVEACHQDESRVPT
mmetsp:Transcript_8329/g.20997  ORF Transcript_8329/g.20997 Transcript_8329/m.20997 type:complete len:268 (+) Transcript_8329:386-1189(+)